MVESVRMARIPGKLLVDLFSDGAVRLVFLPSSGDKETSPVKAQDLDAAEVLFMTSGLSPERAAALRAEVNRNKIASVETNVDPEVAAKFRYTVPYKKWVADHVGLRRGFTRLRVCLPCICGLKGR